MVSISQEQLRDEVGKVLHRAEAGEEMKVTISGRPVATLGPANRGLWVDGKALAAIWQTPAPRTLREDLERLPAAPTDPFA